jgi:hypothetical protein
MAEKDASKNPLDTWWAMAILSAALYQIIKFAQ